MEILADSYIADDDIILSTATRLNKMIKCIHCSAEWHYDDGTAEPMFLNHQSNRESGMDDVKTPLMVKLRIPNIVEHDLDKKHIRDSWSMLHYCECGGLLFIWTWQRGKDGYPMHRQQWPKELFCDAT